MRGGKSMKYTYDHIIKPLKLKLPEVPIPMYSSSKEEKLSKALQAMDNKNAYFNKATSVSEEELRDV